MTLVMLFLAAILFIGAEYQSDSKKFFDKNSSNAMRGFWCLVIVLVHIPSMYQNRIQNMIGSFAYIGVTFFFMTSAYGLRFSIEKNPDSIKHFWRKRLPKLIVPCILVNIVELGINAIQKEQISIVKILYINQWVQWLLVCYMFFWITYRFVKKNRDLIICSLVVGFSLCIYFFDIHITQTTWCTEVFGFLYGILLFNEKERIYKWVNQKWIKKSIFFCLAGIGIGGVYLQFKEVWFLGDYFLKIILGISIIIIMLAFNIQFKIGNKISLFLGNISYEIYLLQWTVMALVTSFHLNNSGIYIIAVLLITILIAWVVHKIVNLVWKILI